MLIPKSYGHHLVEIPTPRKDFDFSVLRRGYGMHPYWLSLGAKVVVLRGCSKKISRTVRASKSVLYGN